jgi:hypothetical protein
MKDLILGREDWSGFDDGYAIVGWDFYCGVCNTWNDLADYWKRNIKCEQCDAEYVNTYDPDEGKIIGEEKNEK